MIMMRLLMVDWTIIDGNWWIIGRSWMEMGGNG